MAAARIPKRGKRDRARTTIDQDSIPTDHLIHVDRYLLSRCLRRLVDNALAFSNPTDGVRVGARTDEENGVRFYVVDSGPGIQPADMARHVEPFNRAADGIAGQRPGLGLGLTLANLETGLHGGELKIDSEPGAGTIANIILPPSGSRPSPRQPNRPIRVN